MSLPLAHLEHWTWVFYVIPVVIVVAGIARGTLAERRRRGDGNGRRTVARSTKPKKRRSR